MLLACMLSMNLDKPLDHDGAQFVAPGALYAREGLLPYRDYPYFHMPNLLFLYAAVYRVTDHLLLAARVLSTAFGLATVAALFFAAARMFRDRTPTVRWMVAGGSALLLATNPLFTFTSGRAWNHDLPVLLTLLATLTLSVAPGGRRELLLAGVVGVLIGAAAERAHVRAGGRGDGGHGGRPPATWRAVAWRNCLPRRDRYRAARDRTLCRRATAILVRQLRLSRPEHCLSRGPRTLRAPDARG